MRVHRIIIAFTVLIISQSLSVHGQWLPQGASSGSIYYNGGSVGIGTATPFSLLHVAGDITAGPSSGGHHLVINDIPTARWALGTGDYALHISNDYPSTSAWVDRMYISRDGNVGIGTSSPANLLDVLNNSPVQNVVGGTAEVAKFSGLSTGPNLLQMKFLYRRHTVDGGWTSISSRLQAVTDVTYQGYIEFNPKDDPYGLAIGTADNVELMRFKQNGNIGIGTTNPGPYKLAVEGVLGARKIKVTQAVPWADYVFENDYKLLSLGELETFIRDNKHLPEVPTAEEVKKDGLDVGDNQATLLKKIEELTLYVIEQNKKLQELDQRLIEYKQENEQLKAVLKSSDRK